MGSLLGCGHQSEDISSLEFTSMGTTASVKARGVSAKNACEIVKKTFLEIEQLLNAHTPDSELNQLSSLSNSEILTKCSPIVRDCYDAAFTIEKESLGAFSPRWRGENTLDLGAIAKGFAIDLAAIKLKEAIPDGPEILIDLGGNLKSVKGDWIIGLHGKSDTFILTTDMSVATSGEYFRGKHIKDARTNTDVKKPVYSVSVIHPKSAMLADALSTVMFILGREKGEKFIKTYYPTAQVIWIIQ